MRAIDFKEHTVDFCHSRGPSRTTAQPPSDSLMDGRDLATCSNPFEAGRLSMTCISYLYDAAIKGAGRKL